jgi:large subunit ribosomal protein L15
MKGQKSRSGGSIRPGFEGGQLALIKGLPMKRGFTNRFKTYYALVKLGTLDGFEPGERVTPEVLQQRGLLRDLKQPVKIMGDGEISKSLTVAAHKFTRSAREKIEAAQGIVEEL